MAIDARKTSDGKISYRVRIFYKQRLIKTEKFSKKTDAEKWETEQKYNIEKQKHFSDEITNIKFKDLISTWIESYAVRKKTQSSIVRDKQIYRDYFKNIFDNIYIKDILPEDIDSVVNNLLDEGRLSNKSINNILSFLRTVLNYAIKKRFLKSNPMSSVEMLTVTPQTYESWSKDDTNNFLIYTNDKYINNRSPFIYYLISLTTGMRMGEIIGLKWDCVDFKNKLITVKRTYDGTLKTVKDGTKGKRIRYVGINTDLLAELIKLRNFNSNSEFVIENSSGNHLDPSNFKRSHFFKDTIEAKVKRIRIHDLRHTYASHYMMNGGNIFDLQQILGHSDTRTTMIYTHLAPIHISNKADIVSFDFKVKNNNVINLKNVISG